jgi:hypothetical protein
MAVDRSKMSRLIAAEVDVWCPNTVDDLPEEEQEQLMQTVEIDLLNALEAVQVSFKEKHPTLELEYDL